MRREKFVHRIGSPLPRAQQFFEHRRHPFGVVADVVHEACADPIRFALRIAAEARERARPHDLREDLLIRRSAPPAKQQRRNDVEAIGFRKLFGAVTRQTMHRLVCEDSDELRSVVGGIDQARRDVNMSARNVERIDLGTVHDVKVPGKLCELRPARRDELTPYLIDVCIRGRVSMDRHLPLDVAPSRHSSSSETMLKSLPPPDPHPVSTRERMSVGTRAVFRIERMRESPCATGLQRGCQS
jgi:hypothetical protein